MGYKHHVYSSLLAACFFRSPRPPLGPPVHSFCHSGMIQTIIKESNHVLRMYLSVYLHTYVPTTRYNSNFWCHFPTPWGAACMHEAPRYYSLHATAHTHFSLSGKCGMATPPGRAHNTGMAVDGRDVVSINGHESRLSHPDSSRPFAFQPFSPTHTS